MDIIHLQLQTLNENKCIMIIFFILYIDILFYDLIHVFYIEAFLFYIQMQPLGYFQYNRLSPLGDTQTTPNHLFIYL